MGGGVFTKTPAERPSAGRGPAFEKAIRNRRMAVQSVWGGRWQRQKQQPLDDCPVACGILVGLVLAQPVCSAFPLGRPRDRVSCWLPPVELSELPVQDGTPDTPWLPRNSWRSGALDIMTLWSGAHPEGDHHGGPGQPWKPQETQPLAGASQYRLGAQSPMQLHRGITQRPSVHLKGLHLAW